MALIVLTTVPTTETPSPGQAGAGKIDKCFYGSPPRLVLDVTVAAAAATVLLYRFDEELAVWVPSAAPASALSVGTAELRYETSSVPGFYSLVRTAGTGTGIYAVREAR